MNQPKMRYAASHTGADQTDNVQADMLLCCTLHYHLPTI